MRLPEEGLVGLVQLARRCAFRPQAALLADVVPLDVELPHDAVLHAVRLHIHRHLGLIRAEILEVGGVVTRCKRVVIPAMLLDDPGKLLGADLLSPFKHHVLEHVGKTGFARFFISGTHAVPDLECEQRGLVVFEKDYLQTVG